MKSISINILLLLLLSYPVKSQVLPKDFSKLNYRIIGFQFPAHKDGGKYKLDIARGNYNNEDSFKRNVSRSLVTDNTRVIVEVSSFGQQYTWQVTSTATSSGQTTKPELHHFSTVMVPNVDTGNIRLRIVQNAQVYKNSFVFLDGTYALYDMNGKPVWYLPNSNDIMNENSKIRNLKLSPNSTITFIAGDHHEGQKIYEVNYNGDILWKGPNNGVVSGDSIEFYHHEFTQLSNGNFLVLGSENIPCYIPGSMDSSVFFYYNEDKHAGVHPDKIPFGTLIEYDKYGNVVWSWKSASYFKNSDLAYRKRADAITNIDPHDNGFYFDEKDSIIYINFRNISRVLKLKYPEGKVLAVYGEKYKPGNEILKNPDFCGQHSCRRSKDGYLYLFNNNVCQPGALPKLVVMQEPVSDNDKLKVVWEYQCTITGGYENKQQQYSFPTDGNVVELPDRNLFASMSSDAYSSVFIVNRAKHILWSAIPEKWNAEEKRWSPLHQYRANIISGRKELEQLIWNAELMQ